MSALHQADQLEKKPEPNSLLTLLTVLVVLLVFWMATRTPSDPDMFWHLRAGEETLAQGRPLTVDTMSFTRLGEKWVNHSWLGQLILYLAYLAGGNAGLALFVAVLACATMLILYRTLKGGPFFRALIVILVSIAISPVWSPRPQQFSLLFFVILLAWIQNFSQKKTEKFWILPLLFILWSNLHGGYSFGFMLLGITLAGMIFDRIFRPISENTPSWKDIGHLADWTAISLIAVLINPNGISTWTIPFQTVGVSVTKYIQEWQSLDFHQITAAPYLVLLFACVIALGLSGRRASGAELAGFALFGAASLTAQRLIGIFGLYAGAFLAEFASPALHLISTRIESTKVGKWYHAVRERNHAKSLSAGLRKSVNLTLVALIALVGLGKLVYVSQPGAVESTLKTYYPVGAVNYLLNNGKPGNILNDYGWGGYLDWRLRTNKVFLDGRADLYPDSLYTEWMDLLAAKPGWENVLKKYSIKYILLPPDMEIIKQAVGNGWTPLYQDSLSILLGQES